MQPKVFNKNFCSPPYLAGRQNTETGGGFRVEAPQKRVDITVFGFEKAHGSTFIVGRRLFAGDKGGDIGSEFIRLKSGDCTALGQLAAAGQFYFCGIAEGKNVFLAVFMR